MKLYDVLYRDFEKLFVGYSALAIILSSCLGSASAMVILMNGHDLIQMIQLFMVIVVSMGYMTSVLSQMKPKVVFNFLLTSISVNLLLLMINIAMRY